MNDEDIIKAVKALKDRHYSNEALSLLKKMEPDIEIGSSLHRKWVHLKAECIYQNRELPTNTRFQKALDVLNSLQENDETKRLKGAVYKRKYQNGKNIEDLYSAITFYESAAQNVDDDEGYGAVNAIYLYYELLAHLNDALDAKTIEMYKSKAKNIALNSLESLEKKYPTPESRQEENREWINPTLAELYLSLYNYEKCNDYLKQSHYKEDGHQTLQALLDRHSDFIGDMETDIRKAMKVDYGIDRKRFTTIEQIIKLYDLLPKHRTEKNDEHLHTIFRGMPEEAEIYNIIHSVRIGKVGLALSGGGFRASLFHIGVLHRLAEMDILRHVQVISSVSGGSIIAMHYYLKLKRLLEENDNFKLEKADYIALVNDLREEFIAGVQTNIRMKAFANKFIYLTEELGRQYQQELFNRTNFTNQSSVPTKMKELLISPCMDGNQRETFKPDFNNFELKNKVPILIINATNLNNGHNWRFTATGMGESPYMYDTTVDKNQVFLYSRYDRFPLDSKDITIGNAVAASSAVPGLFDPIELGDPYNQGDTIKLSDGGVYDNQGIASLVDAECDMIITSDASGQLAFDKEPSNFRFDVLSKIRDILMNKTRDSEFKIAKELYRANRIKGLSILHLKDCFPVDRIELSSSKGEEEDEETPCKQIDLFKTLDKEVQEKLAAVRTDLDAFHDLEAQALIQSGYEITAHWFDTYGQQEEWKYFDRDTQKEICFDKLNEKIENEHEEVLHILDTSSKVLLKIRYEKIMLFIITIIILSLVLKLSISFPYLMLGIINIIIVVGIGSYVFAKDQLKSCSNKLLYTVLRPISKFYLSYFNDLYLKKGKL